MPDTVALATPPSTCRSTTFSIPITIARDEVNRYAALLCSVAAGRQVTPQLVQKRANNCTRYLVGVEGSQRMGYEGSASHKR